MAVMSKAFKEGVYKDNESGLEFGSGSYGDLGAMTAAMLLDREARSVVLDADPAHGSLIEPVLKVVRLMRSLEYQRDPAGYLPSFNRELNIMIGQAPFSIPSVFSFFLPEFEPQGMNSYEPCCALARSPNLTLIVASQVLWVTAVLSAPNVKFLQVPEW